MTKIPSVEETSAWLKNRYCHMYVDPTGNIFFWLENKETNATAIGRMFIDIEKALTEQREAGAREERERIQKILKDMRPSSLLSPPRSILETITYQDQRNILEAAIIQIDRTAPTK